MLGKLYSGLAVVAIATLLAVGALVGLLFGTGRLTPERLGTIAQVMRGELDQTGAGEATALAEATAVPPEEEQTAQAHSAEEVRQQRRDEQVRRAMSERAYRDLVAQRALLDQTLQHLLTAEGQFEEDKASWKAELDRRRGAVRSEGFEKELLYVAKLPPKQAKKHLVLKWEKHPADAVRLLNALPQSAGKRILEQLKTPEEIRIMHELLERLGEDKVDSLESRSGRTAGN